MIGNLTSDYSVKLCMKVEKCPHNIVAKFEVGYN